MFPLILTVLNRDCSTPITIPIKDKGEHPNFLVFLGSKTILYHVLAKNEPKILMKSGLCP